MIKSKTRVAGSQDKLQRDSLIPLYHQLYEILRAQIDNGDWKPGDMIPPESELQKRYGVSQITVRQALNILVDQGLILRRRGKGTFLAKRRIDTNLSSIVNFADDMQRRGFKPRTELIETGHPAMSKNTAAMLQIDVDEETVLIRRLRYADDDPLSLETSILVSKYVPGILENDFSERSLSEILFTDYGIQLAYAQQTIRAQQVPGDVAHLLGIDPDDPVLAIERVSYSQDNTPVEFLRIFYRADRYALHCELKGSTGYPSFSSSKR